MSRADILDSASDEAYNAILDVAKKYDMSCHELAWLFADSSVRWAEAMLEEDGAGVVTLVD